MYSMFIHIWLCFSLSRLHFDFFVDQGVSFTAYDMAGGGRYRNLWEHHFKTCNGVVFVIDSSDRMRLGKQNLQLQN